ncbi:MAG: signal peptidase I [Alphaproteobacteria bacterium]|nr:signal peptidase I [Alphaproteobacteria bacterium]
MFQAFKQRKPWAAAVVAVFLYSPLVMLYLGRWLLAVAYLMAEITVPLVAMWLLPPQTGLSLAQSLTVGELCLKLVAVTHAVLIARRRDRSETLSWYSRWPLIVGLPVLFIAALLANKYFFYPPYYQASDSMAPALPSHDALLVSRHAYDHVAPARGDVIAFTMSDGRTIYVKRVVGVPGDRIQMKQGTLYVNGMTVRLSRIAGDEYEETLPSRRHYHILKSGWDGPLDDTPVFLVPTGHYFVLGDNRDRSLDSRLAFFGFVARTSIVGKASVKIFDGHRRLPVLDAIR